MAGDEGVVAEVLGDGAFEDAHAVAVDDADAVDGGERGGVDELVDGFDGFFGALADDDYFACESFKRGALGVSDALGEFGFGFGNAVGEDFEDVVLRDAHFEDADFDFDVAVGEEAADSCHFTDAFDFAAGAVFEGKFFFRRFLLFGLGGGDSGGGFFLEVDDGTGDFAEGVGGRFLAGGVCGDVFECFLSLSFEGGEGFVGAHFDFGEFGFLLFAELLAFRCQFAVELDALFGEGALFGFDFIEAAVEFGEEGGDVALGCGHDGFCAIDESRGQAEFGGDGEAGGAAGRAGLEDVSWRELLFVEAHGGLQHAFGCGAPDFEGHEVRGGQCECAGGAEEFEDSDAERAAFFGVGGAAEFVQ